MVPNHVMNVLARRLDTDQIRTLALSVGLDPDQAMPPLEAGTSAAAPIGGAIDFDITLVALGHSVTWPARLVWAGEMGDDFDQPGRILSQMQSSLYVLIPTLDDDPAFMWTGLDQRMLPPGADDQLFDQAEEIARTAEAEHKKSNP